MTPCHWGFGSLLVQPGELGAFQRQVVHQPLLAEDEADHRILDVLRVHCLADADVHQRDGTVDPTFQPSLSRNFLSADSSMNSTTMLLACAPSWKPIDAAAVL